MQIEGQKIIAVRKMTEKEIDITWGLENFYDSYVPDCIELDNGDIIIPSRDFEGNGPGVIFGISNNKSYGIQAPD